MKHNTVLDAFFRFFGFNDIDWDADFPHDGYRDVLGRQPVVLTSHERRILSRLTGQEAPAVALDLRPHLRAARQASGK